LQFSNVSLPVFGSHYNSVDIWYCCWLLMTLSHLHMLCKSTADEQTLPECISQAGKVIWSPCMLRYN